MLSHFGAASAGLLLGLAGGYSVYHFDKPTVEVSIVATASALAGDYTVKQVTGRFRIEPSSVETALNGRKVWVDNVAGAEFPEGTEIIFSDIQSLRVVSESYLRSSYQEVSGMEKNQTYWKQRGQLTEMYHLLLKNV